MSNHLSFEMPCISQGKSLCIGQVYDSISKTSPPNGGTKPLVMADSSNGYTVDFNVYNGKAAGQNVSGNGLGYDAVMKRIRPFLKQGYCLFVHNFHTSVTLFKALYIIRESLPQVPLWKRNETF